MQALGTRAAQAAGKQSSLGTSSNTQSFFFEGEVGSPEEPLGVFYPFVAREKMS